MIRENGEWNRAPIFYFSAALFYACVLISFPLLLSASGCATVAGATQAGIQSEPRSGSSLEVLRVSPAGDEVPVGQQIVIQFDRPVVPLGRMERASDEVPVRVTPDPGCEWRWLDPSALSCRLTEDSSLLPATEYRVTVVGPVTALDGARMETSLEQRFTTILPAASTASFDTWRAPGHPVIRVFFNQEVPVESVERRLVLQDPDGSVHYDLQVARDEGERSRGRERDSWVVEPTGELPLDRAVQLVAQPGLESARGTLVSRNANTVVEFHTFPEFRFLGIECTDLRGQTVQVDPGARQTAGCDPQNWVSLRFSAPVIKEELSPRAEIVGDDRGEHGLVVVPDLAGGRSDHDPWEQVYSYSQLYRPRRWGEVYRVELPGALHARERYHLSAGAESIRDEFGRPLESAIDFSFSTDDRRPRAVIDHRISVLERDVPTHVPLVVTNLESAELLLETLTTKGRSEQRRVIELGGPRNLAYRTPLRVRDWLEQDSGAALATFETEPRSGSPQVFFTQVTPFQVHAKVGHTSSAVWVTDLKSGAPVGGALVSIAVDPRFGLAGEPALAQARTDATGFAPLPGRETLDPDLGYSSWMNLSSPRSMLVVKVEKDDAIALLPAAESFSVRPEGPGNAWIPNRLRRRFGHLRAFGVTAQGVYRLGSRVHFKIWVRDQNERRLGLAPQEKFRLEVIDPRGKVVYREDSFTLSGFGAHHGEFDLPEKGAMGWHRFVLSFANRDEGARQGRWQEEEWQPLEVLVTDFTPAPFRVTTELDGDRFGPGDKVTVQTAARLHAGGPYVSARTRIDASLQATAIETSNSRAQGYYFESPGSSPRTLYQHDGELDAAGDLQTAFEVNEQSIVHGRLLVESSVRDDRGKSIAHRAAARFVGRDRWVGVRQPDWLLEAGKPAEVLALVIDESDRLAVGQSVSIEVQYEKVEASRVKGAGNAYLTEYVRTWQPVAGCDAVSAEEPMVCTFTPQASGRYRMTASVIDTQGRRHRSSLDRWSLGAGYALWQTPPGHHLPIEVEKSEYRVGDTARFLIRNPFPGAHALITVERLGVMQHFTRVLESSAEVFELEIEPDHLPGFYFSCVVTSPRVEAPPIVRGGDFAEVDLGKPSMRMGYVRVPVVDPYKQIEVTVTPQRESYRPRERVKLDLVARHPHPREGDGGSGKEPIELAITVLDEAVFDLLAGGRDKFDPYGGFYSLDPLDLSNYNLLTRLVGIQSFDKKGANAGGDGAGGAELRSIFRFVGYWNPSVSTDSEGRATVEFDLPDNLTGWRVLAMAATPTDRLGLGEGRFVVDLPVELRAALPNQVTEGDRFDARFTVMNRTPDSRAITVRASIGGVGEGSGLDERVIEAEPYRRYPVSFPVLARVAGRLDLTISARSGEDGDRLSLPLEVGRRSVLETAASYGTTVEGSARDPVLFPQEMRTDVGSLGVTLAPSVIGNVDGAFRYMGRYPYYCWEQRLTKAVMAAHLVALQDWVSGVNWPGHQELTQQTLDLAPDFQAPNGGMAYWVAADGYVSPYLSAYTALAFGWLETRGYRIPAGVSEGLDEYLDRLLRDDVFPSFFDPGMASSVRAVALAALAKRGKITAADVERYRRALPEMSLFGKAHYLQAALTVDEPSLAEEASRAILSHADQSGGRFQFTESLDLSYQRILSSSLRANCSILTAFVRQVLQPSEGTGIGDLPFRLVRTITQSRGRRDHWENTQENVFCMNALVEYSQAYERDPVDMAVQARAGGRALGEAVFGDVKDAPVTLERPLRRSDRGKRTNLELQRSGSGRLYWSTRVTWSPLELPTTGANAGIGVHREYSVERDGQWQLLESPMQLERGELVRVDLYLDLPAARNFVVVDDPVPGGIEPVNRDLATASQVDAEKGEVPRAGGSFWFSRDGWRGYADSRWSFYHRELGHDAVRFYSDWLAPGAYHLAWLGQVIASGEFQVLPVKAEEMYDPDVFGRGAAALLRIVGDSPEGP